MLNGPAILGPFTVNAQLPEQNGSLTSTVITFTRPDGALIQSSYPAVGSGLITYNSETGQSMILFNIPAGVLNQPGTWLFDIRDPTVTDQTIISGRFNVRGSSPVEDFARPIPPYLDFNVPKYKLIAFDASCTVYTLLSPSTFEQTDPTTLRDNWCDMTVAVNDGSTAYALYNEDVSNLYTPDGGITFPFDNTRGGVCVVIPPDSPPTAPIRSFSPGVPFDGLWLSATSCAFSANGTILVPISEWDSIGHPAGTVYPRISRDFGQTWADVTGLPVTGGALPGNPWTRACFSANAQIMYIHRYKSFIYKSIDSGVTWNALPNSPKFDTEHGNIIIPGLAQNSLRMRCSADGSVIAAIDWGGNFHVSKDGGVTWSYTDFGTIVSPADPSKILGGDFGMPIDGSFFYVAVGVYFAASSIWRSNDGVNWTEKTFKHPSARKETAFTFDRGACNNCFVSPDGTHAAVIYNPHQSNSNAAFLSDGSYTGGVETWAQQPITSNVATVTSGLMAAHMVPVSS